MSRGLVAALLIPALVLVGWVLAEQLPAWLAAPPPWERYGELITQAGGCEASWALAALGAAANGAPGVGAEAALARILDEHFPQVDAEVLVPPTGIHFSDRQLGWYSLVEFPREDSQALLRSVLILANDDGTAQELVQIVGGTRDERCGDYAPQPQGMRARLRPYLPLLALAGYGVVIIVGALALRLRRSLQA